MLEERAASVYRGYAATMRAQPEACALWTEMAREEDEHARTITAARRHLDPVEGWRTRVDGWDEAIAEVETRLEAADRLTSGAGIDQQLLAALELEGSELEALRQALLTLGTASAPLPPAGDHVEHLARAAARLSTDPQVLLEAALLLARARLKL